MDKARLTVVYEDNAGGLHLVHSVGDETVWAHSYGPGDGFGGYTAAEVAAHDFIALALCGDDPVADGWEGNEADLHGDDFVAVPIAWGGDEYPAPEPRWSPADWDRAGYAGREFLRTAFEPLAEDVEE